jgi:hypothetical protein
LLLSSSPALEWKQEVLQQLIAALLLMRWMNFVYGLLQLLRIFISKKRRHTDTPDTPFVPVPLRPALVLTADWHSCLSMCPLSVLRTGSAVRAGAAARTFGESLAFNNSSI